MGAPSSILPFTMQLGRAVLNGSVQEAQGVEVLDVIESFLVRRAIAGYEPTGLHAVFKRLWPDLEGEISAEKVINVVSAHRTVPWPDDEELMRAVASRPLYGSAITPYLLREYDYSLGGDAHDHIETIEHVLPQTADAEWKRIYGERHVEEDVDTLPNLVPCTGRMNASLGNQLYAVKSARFAKDSKFKSTREFSAAFEVWNRAAFEQRAKAMGEWACHRWPHSRSTSVLPRA